MEIDLAAMTGAESEAETGETIRERKKSGAIFTTARGGDRLSAVTVWLGEGRDRKERRINLTNAQGSFLFHLPFPNADPMSPEEIMEKAGVEDSYAPEVRDLVEVLVEGGVIEIHRAPG